MITAQSPKPSFNSEEKKRIHLNKGKDEMLESTLEDIKNKQKERFVEQDARSLGQRYINLKQFPISNDALQLLDREYSGQQKVVSFYYDPEQIRLGSTDPSNSALAQKAKELEKIHRTETLIYRISQESLDIALRRYDAIPKMTKATTEGIELNEETLKKQQEKIRSIQDMSDMIARTAVTDVLALIVGSALKSGASDIHIEAEADDIKIRLRIDGVLHDIGMLPKDAWPRVIARIKLVAGLKLNIINEPQDGRFTITLDNDKIEVRTSTVPTSYGESVVMRLLRFSVEALKLEHLGLTGYTLGILQQEINKPNGMIISTGPTGSGKTTTLYAILHILNNPETKILTLEDPVEYKLKGINQTQINPGKGFDFAKGLKSILRQDPDIIMVGEIRDLVTADTAINAALTGHLMLSTLHTNSAAGAIPRFLAMGSKPFLLAPSINALIGQRLVRRLCEHCKQPHDPEQVIRARILKAIDPIKDRTDLGINVDLKNPDSFRFFQSKGCDQCNGLGYKGRIGIYEILTMNKDLEKIILSGSVSEYAIQDTAVSHGMITMLQDGLMKTLMGITSVFEVFRQVE